MKKHVILVALCLMAAGPTSGEIVSYTFTGTVSSKWGSSLFGTSVQVGDPLTGFISYDTGASNLLLSATERNFYQSPPLAFGITLGGLTLRSDSIYIIDVSRQDIGTLVQHIQMWDSDHQIKVNDTLTNVLGFDLAFTIPTSNPTLTLPFDLLAVGEITFQHGTVDVFNELGRSGIGYDLTSLTIVPEPGTMGLLLMGILVVALYQRR